jgi:hypothetical protein
LKVLIIILLSLTVFNTHLFADDSQINPDTARAYEGYLVSFIWPKGQSIEQIDYKNLLPTDRLLRFMPPDDDATNISNNTNQITPFGNIEKRLGHQVKILANQKWTLIFKQPEDTISKQFHSEQEQNGYPELTGNIAIKLGRYLESDIDYKHYLFDRVTQTTSIPEKQETENEQSNQPISIFSPSANVSEIKPVMILKLHQSNKTASKKVNYLDHPTIGTLLYFEPIELEQAIENIALQSMTPETGQSLTYDELQSTNELSDR